ncbi:50S ribosomal protein L29 [Mycoplasma struthionis]|nr:50S ribosomal protein L29 [Mycoplasma struthionis]AZG68738.1 50S ribosomal protein L29 [Mycoplasma struthionis]
MSYKELKNKSTQELKDLLKDLRAELFSLRFKNGTRQLDQTHKIQLVRKDIARALTALQTKLAEGDKK